MRRNSLRGGRGHGGRGRGGRGRGGGRGERSSRGEPHTNEKLVLAGLVEFQDVLTKCPNVNEYMQSLANTYNLAIRHENKKTKDSGRILLGARRGTPPPNEFISMCNGLIIDVKDRKCVAVPSPVLQYSASNARINQLLGRGVPVFPADDGTIVTLYWYNNQWHIGSGHGYDVSNYVLRGPLTYAEALFQVLKQYPKIAEDMSLVSDQDESKSAESKSAESKSAESKSDKPVVSETLAARICAMPITNSNPTKSNCWIHFNKLSKQFCYTIGFRHHDFHPLVCDPQRAWLIQRYDFAKKCIDMGPMFDIPRQQPVVFKPDQKNINYIRASCLGALEEAQIAIKKGISAPMRYGYIITGSPTERILVETDLLDTMRELFYVHTGMSNALYKELRAYLGAYTQKLYISLIPQSADRFALYAEYFGCIIASIMTGMYRDPDIERACKCIKPLLLKQEPNFHSITDMGYRRSLVSDCVHDPNLLEMFVALIEIAREK